MIASMMMSEWQSSMSDSVPFTSGASSTARLHVGAFDLLVVRDFVQHALHAAGERRLVGVHERDGDAALDVRGGDALAHDAGADDAGRRDLLRLDIRRRRRCLSCCGRCRKNTLSSARLIGEPNSLANSSASIWQAVSTSTPAAPSITSSAASGAG